MKLLVRLLLGLLCVASLISCGRSVEPEWVTTENGVRIFMTDTLSNFFSKVKYEWEGGKIASVANGEGILKIFDSDGRLVEKRKIDIWYGAVDRSIVNSKSSNLYFGEERKGKAHGFGVRKAGDAVYIGDFKKNKGNGDVTVITDEKLFYSGEWKRDKITGYGNQYDADGVKIYSGNFRNGEFSGQGTSYDAAGGIIYDGKWKHGKWHGLGTAYTADKDKYAGTHVWKKGDLPKYFKKKYDRIQANAGKVTDAKAYDRVLRYERFRALYIIGIIIFLGLMALLLYTVNGTGVKSVTTRKEPMKKLPNYLLWLVGGFWGLHRAKLCVFESRMPLWIMSQFIPFSLMVLLNMGNISIYLFSPSWFILSHFSVLTIILFIINILWMLADLVWIPYQIYVLTAAFYRRQPDELDILQGRKTAVEQFYGSLKGELDRTNGEFPAILAKAQTIMDRKFTGKDDVFSKMAKSISRDGSLEFEQKKLDDLIKLSDKVYSLGSNIEWQYDQLYSYLTEARLTAYRNMYLAKELINHIKTISGKTQILQTDVYKGMEALNFNIDWSATSSVSWDISGAMDNFNTFQKSLAGMGFKGSKSTAAALGMAALVAIVDNIDARNEQKKRAVEAQAKIIEGIKKSGEELTKLSAEILRSAEKMSALFNANKAFVKAYCHLRDIVFGDISFKNFIHGVNKDNPAFMSEKFIKDVQHLTVVCSEYNKINKAK